MRFINRKEELRMLEEEYKKTSARFAVVYGKRRIGKTRLIEEFIKDKKDYIYYLAADETDTLQIKELKNMIAALFNDDFLRGANISEWKELFSYLERIWPKKKIILIIDEVTYLIKNNSSFTSYFQKFWDLFLSKTNTMVIFSGSIVRLMLEYVLKGKSPLYGRRTAEIFLDQFSIKEISEFLNCNIEDAIKYFGIIGGIPKYLELVDGKFKEFTKRVTNKNSFFYREGYYLMTEELKDISTYSNILRAIAEGNTQTSKIANFSGIEARKLYPYIEILESLKFVEKELPVLSHKKSRGAIYTIKDNFLDFWFSFIHKHRNFIEINDPEIQDKIIQEMPQYLGRKFEIVCRNIIRAFFKMDKVGRQWGKTIEKNVYEIDIAGYNKEEIVFGECKWKENVDASRVIKQLAKKVEQLEYKNKRIHFVLFAKSFVKKINWFENKKVYCFDLKQTERILLAH